MRQFEAQRQRIADYCRLKGLHLAEVYEDTAISGGKPLARRPAGSQLLARAKKSKALVIVAKLDRLFCFVADAATGITDFDRKGSEQVAIAKNFGKCVFARPTHLVGPGSLSSK